MRSERPLVPDTELPTFGTLLWDNLKTTVVNGILGSMIIGAIACFIGGIVASFVLLPPLPSAIIIIYSPKVLSALVIGMIGIAFLVAAPIFAPLGALIGALIAFPFTWAAQRTRKFQANKVIEPKLESLSTHINAQAQQHAINKIIRKVTLRSEKKTGISSYSSSNLMYALESTKTNTEEKWKALTEYMHDKSGNAYVNNGKKLFNTILKVAGQKQDEEVEKLRQELSILIPAIFSERWRVSKNSLFGHYVSVEIDTLQKLLNQSKVTDEDSIRNIKPEHVYELCNALTSSVNSMKDTYPNQKPAIQMLHKLISSLGMNTEMGFQPLYEFIPNLKPESHKNDYAV